MNPSTHQFSPVRTLVIAATVAVLVAGGAQAIISVTVVDGSVSLSGFTPVAGQSATLSSTTDVLRFSNSGATEREAIMYTLTFVFTDDQAGTTSTTSLSYQGGTTLFKNIVWGAQSSSGGFLPFEVVTTTDRWGQSGWTKHANCATLQLQGEWSIPWYSNAAVAQTPLLQYYQVCDSVEIYVDADKDLSNGDFSNIVTQTTLLTTPETDYEIVIQGTDFLFASAADANSVTLRQGRFVPITATDVDSYFLELFPDGFPAGVLSTTLTATAYDITV